MKNRVWLFVFLFSATMALGSRAAAQDASIEFVAHATPSGGLEEPVRGFPFFLLSRSFVEIGKEAEATYPKPDMDAFIAKLDVSPELKAWMKKHDWVMLAGEDFIKKLHPDDILAVPEFKTAYMDRNAGDQSADFPKPPKIKASDQTKDPAKFDKLAADYVETIRHYIGQHPQSVDGIDLNLASIDPSPRWNGILVTRITAIHRRTLDLAESTYLVARAETNLQGQGFMRGLAPGTYWLSTLDNPATVGDARPRWDIPVVLRAGETKYITLSNSNSVRPQASQ
ncbi:MAG: hypothetical protein WB949_09575 [Candidatus Acidiferrales bacterium]